MIGAGRLRFPAGLTILTGLLLTAWAAPVAAAECTLTAPAYVNVGMPISIEGAGFPASANVNISLSIEGGTTDAFSIQSDGTGGVLIVLTPEDFDVGLTTVRAGAGSACTAEVGYTVLAAGATPPPAQPEAEDSSGTGTAQGAPRTNVIHGSAAARSSGPPWALGFALMGVGCLGLLLARAPRRT